MSKVLVIDPLSFKGHAIYNYGIVEAVSKKHDCDIVLSKYLASKLIEMGVQEGKIKAYSNDLTLEFISKKIKIKIFYHLIFRLYSVFIILRSLFTPKKYDCIFFTSVDVYSFAILSYLIRGKIFVVDHGIGRIKTNKWYRFFWKLLSKKINIIVMEPYIKDMVNHVLKRKNIFIVKHPLPKKKKEAEFTQNGIVRIFAPGISNDSNIIKDLETYPLPKNIEITIKGKENKFYNNIRVYNNFISDEEYAKLFATADYILIPYGNDYNYRTSAVLFESAVANKNVLIFSNNTLKKYESIFPGKVLAVDSIQHMIDIICNKNHSFSHKPYNLSEYTCEEIAKKIDALICNA